MACKGEVHFQNENVLIIYSRNVIEDFFFQSQGNPIFLEKHSRNMMDYIMDLNVAVPMG